MERLTVTVDPAYDVVVGAGVLSEAVSVVGRRRCVALVSQDAILGAYGDGLLGAFDAVGTRVLTTTMADGEDAKSMATVESLCRRWAADGLLRGDAVLALGGGVVGDTAGFAAAVYHRGVAVVQCPTTLLAQVDAAIGGKTAVNLPEGKNLVGAFHQPLGVLADVGTLDTLPAREYRAGLGEVAKYALMGLGPDSDAVGTALAGRRAEIEARDPAVLTELVTRCVAIKVHVVSTDPEERTGLRATLNYGHTLAHALETVGRHDLHHGEAVAVGLVFAGALGEAMERVPPGATAHHREVVAGLGLPTEAPGHTAAELTEVMRRDKKARGGLSFVLLGPNGLEPVDDPPAPALETAFAAVGIDS